MSVHVCVCVSLIMYVRVCEIERGSLLVNLSSEIGYRDHKLFSFFGPLFRTHTHPTLSHISFIFYSPQTHAFDIKLGQKKTTYRVYQRLRMQAVCIYVIGANELGVTKLGSSSNMFTAKCKYYNIAQC